MISYALDCPAVHRAALNLVGETVWYMPARFAIAKLLGPPYSLRCVLFHNVSDKESSFTRGLDVTTTRSNFEAALKFLTRHYTPVRLSDVLTEADSLPARPVLVTFDDGYASVSELAAPLCRKFGVPAVFFVNAAYLDNQHLALDNLVCHVANVLGLDVVSSAVRAVNGFEKFKLRTLAQIFDYFLPAVSLSGRQVFRAALLESTRSAEHDLAREAGLYLTTRQLRDLAAFEFEIGNHTYTHVNCRSLSRDDFSQEIDKNRKVLEAISGRRVRSFSVPYGSSVDLTAEVGEHLYRSSHEVAFLAEGTANAQKTAGFQLDRVSIKASSDAAFFSEIEVLPRLRAIRKSLFGTSPLGASEENVSFKQVRPHEVAGAGRPPISHGR